MASRVLITGASGFVGGYLAAELASAGHEVHGLARGGAPEGFPGEWHRGDVAESARFVRDLGADAIFHLVVAGTEIALEAAPTVVVVGSAAEYGSQTRLPIAEDAPLNPVTPYGEAKAAQRRLVGDRATYACVFNLVGPGLPDRLAPGAFARQIAAIEGGTTPAVVRTGNLSSTRDYVDVRDAARAIRLLAEAGAVAHGTDARGPVNVCTGLPVATRDLLELLITHATVAIDVEEAGKPSPSDPPEHYGDPTRFVTLTGWQPEIPLGRSAADLLDSWRTQLRSEAPK
jgi:GDP-4-dehydro-6-deoxy-D-mannose reductase